MIPDERANQGQATGQNSEQAGANVGNSSVKRDEKKKPTIHFSPTKGIVKLKLAKIHSGASDNILKIDETVYHGTGRSFVLHKNWLGNYITPWDDLDMEDYEATVKYVEKRLGISLAKSNADLPAGRVSYYSLCKFDVIKNTMDVKDSFRAFDRSDPMQFLDYLIVRSQPWVAPSERAVDPSRHLFFLEEENADIVERAKEITQRNALLKSLMSLSTSEKRMLILVHKYNHPNDSIKSLNISNNALLDQEDFLTVALESLQNNSKCMNNLINLIKLKETKTDPRYEVMSLIVEGLNQGNVIGNANGLVLRSGAILGQSYPHAVKHLSSPEGEKLKVELLNLNNYDK